MHDYRLVETYPGGRWFDPDGKRQPGLAMTCQRDGCGALRMFTRSDDCPGAWWEPLLYDEIEEQSCS